MFVLNKIVWAVINPLALVFLLGVVAWMAVHFHHRGGKWVGLAALVLLWLFSMPAGPWMLGLPLERPFLPERPAADYPVADAILLLGGGMRSFPGAVYPDCNQSADRVWHAARLYLAGRAPLVIPSGVNDRESTVPLLLALGVPDSAIQVEDEARNTEENIGYSVRLLQKLTGKASPRVLLVTSAWHMRRALLNARLGGLDAIPAPCDFMATASRCGGSELARNWVLPDPQRLADSATFAKEWVGILEKQVLGRGSK